MNFMSNYVLRILGVLIVVGGMLTACGGINSGFETVRAESDGVDKLPNSSAVSFLVEAKKGEQVAVFAGGCFWGVEAVFEHVRGVRDVSSGYSGGKADTADYETVSGGKTDHAEAVRVVFNPAKISYEQLLKVFFSVAHDPTELNRQGPDIGRHYRSAIFYTNDEQKRLAEKYIAELDNSETFAKPIVTEIVSLKKFYLAEDYHQNYMSKHPNQAYIVIHDKPKIENLQKQFPDLYVSK